jgi:hypothetical protein
MGDGTGVGDGDDFWREIPSLGFHRQPANSSYVLLSVMQPQRSNIHSTYESTVRQGSRNSRLIGLYSRTSEFWNTQKLTGKSI